jgi:hypothetical protein
MGMEGKLRRISEFELAAYRKNPAKLYSDIFPVSASPIPNVSKIDSLIKEVQESAVGRRIRERALAGENPFREDMEALKREMQNAFKEFPQFANVLEDARPGLTSDKKQLSLHKSWNCLHYLFTGKAWEADGSALGKAIFGGAEIPDVNKVMGYGPMRYLLPAEVQQVSEALHQFPIQVKAEAYDPVRAKAEKVYLPDHGVEELTAYFNDLREFYGLAAQNGDAVLLWVE